MIGSNGAEACPEDSVRPSRVDPQGFISAIGESKIDIQRLRERPIQFSCIARTLGGQRSREPRASSKLVAVVGDPTEPLRQTAALDRGPGAPALAVNHLFIGQHRMVDRIPVDPAVLAVDQVLFKEVDKDGLLVTIVIGIAGGEFADQSIDSPMARSWSRMVAMF